MYNDRKENELGRKYEQQSEHKDQGWSNTLNTDQGSKGDGMWRMKPETYNGRARQ